MKRLVWFLLFCASCGGHQAAQPHPLFVLCDGVRFAKVFRSTALSSPSRRKREEELAPRQDKMPLDGGSKTQIPDQKSR